MSLSLQEQSLLLQYEQFLLLEVLLFAIKVKQCTENGSLSARNPHSTFAGSSSASESVPMSIISTSSDDRKWSSLKSG